VPLGTREVAAYRPADWTYDKILVVEKAGLWPVLEAARIAERYDMAVITSEGFGTVACRELLASMPPGDVKIFSLHDADIAGYNLSLILGEETVRMPGHSVEVIDLGLTVADAIRLEINPENFTRKKAIPARVAARLTAVEREWFEGERDKYAGGWRCRRTELNAFTSPGLIGFIEQGLEANGATAKVIPPHQVVGQAVRDASRDLIAAEVARLIDEIIDRDAITAEQVRRIGGRAGQGISRATLLGALERDRAQSWRRAVSDVVAARLALADAGLREQIREFIAGKLAGPADPVGEP
jgi:hypothetical protein